jgi:hypothetical protein
MDINKITPETLLDTLKSMAKDQVLVYDADKDSCQKLELLNLKQDSYQKLFASYINNTCEEANKFNLDRFLGKYYNVCKNQMDLQDSIIIQAISSEAYNYIKSIGQFCPQINLQVCKVIIRKIK